MKTQTQSAPDLATLCRYFGEPIPPADSSAKVNEQISTAPQRYILRATKWHLRSGEFRTANEIAGKVDNRPLLQLRSQLDELLGQMFFRAAKGDEQALMSLLVTAQGLVANFELLQKVIPEKIMAAAEISTNWPVVLSPNPQDIKRAKQHVTLLRVGERALTPRHPSQRRDPGNFWTVLSSAMFKTCNDNRQTVIWHQAHCKGAKRERKIFHYWNTPVEATYYYPDDTHYIVIADWEARCVDLSLPVSEDCFKQWWQVIQSCTLEYWNANTKAYHAALRQIGNNKEAESRRRNLAFTQLRQSFRTIVGLRQKG